MMSLLSPILDLEVSGKSVALLKWALYETVSSHFIYFPFRLLPLRLLPFRLFPFRLLIATLPAECSCYCMRFL